ncbi:copper amine oxidase N-terminal domain-containing protein [Paenibacillus peoriae]|uniref:copper amine oxidase N-terminal domain-containing protein n=1 Tax=Paenibacillus peoriae TaxID=59893 RepID=UPI00215B1D9E|nr:copper amine oxidase N-terminal domain-containing protein [Paenibacillus peoriae]
MKKTLLTLLTLMLVLGAVGTASASAAAKSVAVTVNGKAVVFPDGKSVMEGDRVLIPVRFVSEALGAKVDYKNRTVLIKQDGKSISMKVNSAIVSRDQDKLLLDVPARIKNSRVYVPLRFVSEALGAQVDWSKAKMLVAITTGTAPTKEPEKKPEETKKVFKSFEWGQKTELGKALFKNNVKYMNGQVTFTVPEGSEASYLSAQTGLMKLKPGQKYTYSSGNGSISFSKIYAKENDVESYGLSLDTKSEYLSHQFDDVTNDLVVDHIIIKNGKMHSTAGRLSEVVAAAQSL